MLCNKSVWARSLAGKAPRSQRGDRGFESLRVHYNKAIPFGMVLLYLNRGDSNPQGHERKRGNPVDFRVVSGPSRLCKEAQDGGLLCNPHKSLRVHYNKTIPFGMVLLYLNRGDSNQRSLRSLLRMASPCFAVRFRTAAKAARKRP